MASTIAALGPSSASPSGSASTSSDLGPTTFLLPASAPVTGRHARGHGSVVPTLPGPVLAQSRAQQPLGRKAIVRVEFVYVDDGSRQADGDDIVYASEVGVQGDWNEWKTVEMVRVTEDPRVWTVVTGVSTGYHEFRFVVDKCVRVSTRHPTTASGTSNWRTILGSARASVPVVQESPFRVLFRRLAVRTGLTANPVDTMGFTRSNVGKDNSFALPSTMKTPQKSLTKTVAHIGAVGAIVIVLSAYLIVVAVYALVFGH